MHVAVPFAGTSHTAPQAAQFSGSDSMSTQLSPHDLKPGSQAMLHAEAAQEDLPCSGVGHAVPQLPQCAAEFVVSMHAALQLVLPAAQVSEHVPLEHTWPAGHAVPHPPQFEGSLEASTQTPLQRFSAASQVTPHVLAAQVRVPPAGAMHFCPQAPQLSTSIEVSTQRAPQDVKPSSHTTPQWPAHTACPCSGAVHWKPQPLQFSASVPSVTHFPAHTV